jgi:hypothetical protein
VKICRTIGDLWFVSYFLWILAASAVESGDYEPARAHADESLKIARELEGPLLVVCALDAMAAVARAEGDDEAAESHLAEPAEIEIGRSEIVPHSYLASVLRGLGELSAARGDLTAAEASSTSRSRAHTESTIRGRPPARWLRRQRWPIIGTTGIVPVCSLATRSRFSCRSGTSSAPSNRLNGWPRSRSTATRSGVVRGFSGQQWRCANSLARRFRHGDAAVSGKWRR